MNNMPSCFQVLKHDNEKNYTFQYHKQFQEILSVIQVITEIDQVPNYWLIFSMFIIIKRPF
jgi:hypothetical protein